MISSNSDLVILFLHCSIAGLYPVDIVNTDVYMLTIQNIHFIVLYNITISQDNSLSIFLKSDVIIIQ